jgi:putative ABC transport system permease protein
MVSLAIGFLSGSYPAFILSSHDSLSAIKGKWLSVKENLFFKRTLLVTQFAIAIFVFVGTVVIFAQIKYLFAKDLGFNKETVLSFALPRDWTPKGVASMEVVRNELARMPQVREASLSYEIPNGRNGFSASLYLVGSDSTLATSAMFLQTDEKYAETYQLSMLAGKFFQRQSDSTHLVVSEKTIKALGFVSPSEALEQAVKIQNDPRTYRIGGVVKDFHFQSMHQELVPLAFFDVRFTNMYRFMSLKLETKDLANTVAGIEQKFHQLLPEAPFEFSFVDDAVQKLYTNETRLGKAAQIATILALLIVLLGIFGVVSLATARKTKEIGIRKVLGASVQGIILLFLKDFFLIIGIAIALVSPLVYGSMAYWLQAYPYRIALTWDLFVYVDVAPLGIVCLLVGLQAGKAAVTNPVKSLRSE